MESNYISLLHHGLRALKSRGGLYALLARLLKGVTMPDREFDMARPGSFREHMEGTNWVRVDGKRVLTMFAYVAPFTAFFNDSDGIYLLNFNQVHQVPGAESNAMMVNRTHIPVIIEGDVVMTFHLGGTTANPVSLTECAELPVGLACTGCKTPSFRKLQKCSQCRTALYCNRECQKKDWKEHKKTCH